MIGVAMPGTEPDRRILPFRPRGSVFARPVPRSSPVEDLAKYEHGPEPDDYRHRMLINGLTFGVTVLLVIAGIWIADVMAQMRKNQDCVLMGRPGCTPVQAPPQQR